jgi:hypothetical protein
VNFAKRLHAMTRLGQATLKVAERAFHSRIRSEDDERRARLGDIDGQTKRAQAFADRLEGSVLTEFADPVTVKPKGWFR